MNRINITGALGLPRVINDVELVPEAEFPLPVRFDLGAAGVQRNDSTTIAVALSLAGKSETTFACLFLDVPSAKALAAQLLEVTAALRHRSPRRSAEPVQDSAT
jgi:hypothetical protein